MWNIAFNTFRELVRNKILYGIVVFALGFVALSVTLSTLALGDTLRFVRDLGLAGVEIFGLAMTLFVGGQLLFKEVDGKTVYLVLTKPVPRRAFVLGKFLGFALTLGVVMALQAAAYLATLWWMSGHAPAGLIWVAIACSFAKLLVTFAVLLAFSTFTGSFTAILAALLTYFAAHGVAGVLDLAGAARTRSEGLEILGKVLYGALPNFEALNVKGVLDVPDIAWDEALGLKFPYALPVANLLYAGAYGSLVLAAACWSFGRKNFDA